MQTHITTAQRDEAAHADNLILSKIVKAGRRTYFLDVHSTRGGDYFLTITESRKKTCDDGSIVFDRHKIFLYKEDFDKFADGLQETIDFIRQSQQNFATAKAPQKNDTER